MTKARIFSAVPISSRTAFFLESFLESLYLKTFLIGIGFPAALLKRRVLTIRQLYHLPQVIYKINAVPRRANEVYIA